MEFEKDKPMGDKIRVLNTELAKKYDIIPQISLRDGIDETIEWYLNDVESLKFKFNAFDQN